MYGIIQCTALVTEVPKLTLLLALSQLPQTLVLHPLGLQGPETDGLEKCHFSVTLPLFAPHPQTLIVCQYVSQLNSLVYCVYCIYNCDLLRVQAMYKGIKVIMSFTVNMVVDGGFPCTPQFHFCQNRAGARTISAGAT